MKTFQLKKIFPTSVKSFQLRCYLSNCPFQLHACPPEFESGTPFLLSLILFHDVLRCYVVTVGRLLELIFIIGKWKLYKKFKPNSNCNPKVYLYAHVFQYVRLVFQSMVLVFVHRYIFWTNTETKAIQPNPQRIRSNLKLQELQTAQSISMLYTIQTDLKYLFVIIIKFILTCKVTIL